MQEILEWYYNSFDKKSLINKLNELIKFYNIVQVISIETDNISGHYKKHVISAIIILEKIIKTKQEKL